MRKTGLCLMVLVCLTLINPYLPPLRAKMSVISPQDMIKISDYIIVGEIEKDITTKKRNAQYTATNKEVTISIESVLKGEMAQKEIVLKRDFRTDIWITDGVNFNFPKKGTRVMLLLRIYEKSGLSLTYANSICVIKKGKVQLYDGMGFGSNNVKFETIDYEKAYQTFYDQAIATSSSSDMRVFRLTADDVQSAHVKWGPRFHWMLTRDEIDSLITILRKARKEDIQPYNGPLPKRGPLSVSLTTKSNEHFTFTFGVGGKGYILCPGGKVYLPKFSDYMKPFKVRRAIEAHDL